MKEPCRITINPWDEEANVNVECGDVSVYTIVNHLTTLQKHFAQVLMDAAKKAVGDDEEKQVEWLDKMIEKHKNGEI